nr:polyprenyl synthetase family protein [Agromyces seonyuensis]
MLAPAPRTLTGAAETIEVDLVAVLDRLERWFDERTPHAGAAGPAVTSLWAAARLETRGGKKLRPRLVLAAFHGLGGGASHRAAAIETAAAYELLHTAFLLHDDVIDGDTVRRGRPNLVGRLAEEASEGTDAAGAERWGRAAAILAGDLLLHGAQHLIARLDLDAARRIRLLDALDECVRTTAAGEASDVAFETGAEMPSLAASLRMAEQKTAVYTFEAPLVAGAVLAGAGHDAVAALADYGRDVGTAFQLRDDLLGVFGDERATGKSTLADLASGKSTPLVAWAREHAGDELDAVLATPGFGPVEAARARSILEGSGARTHVEERIDRLIAGARERLRDGELPGELVASLGRIAREAGERAA